MKKRIIYFLSASLSAFLLATPIFANSVSKGGNGGTSGYTYIVGIGTGNYKQAQVQTKTNKQVDTISVKGDYYVVNRYEIGTPSDTNRWSTKAEATLTYAAGNLVVRCDTTHIADGADYVMFTTQDTF